MIFDLQRYSTHDGPGIRTLVFLKGCSLACRWCQNPESRSPKPDILLDRRQCIEDAGSAATPARQSCVTARVSSSPAQPSAIRMWNGCAASAPAKRCRCAAGREPGHPDGHHPAGSPLLRAQRRRVTLSGGEPFMQPEFAASLLARCQAEGCIPRWKVACTCPGTRLNLASPPRPAAGGSQACG